MSWELNARAAILTQEIELPKGHIHYDCGFLELKDLVKVKSVTRIKLSNEFTFNLRDI